MIQSSNEDGDGVTELSQEGLENDRDEEDRVTESEKNKELQKQLEVIVVNDYLKIIVQKLFLNDYFYCKFLYSINLFNIL